MGIEEEVHLEMEKVVNHFKQELGSLRTNRAHPGLVESLLVEVYGSQKKIKELANITIPEPRQLLLMPFDLQNIVFITKAIEKANLNLVPVAERSSIRITVPPIDQSMRRKIVDQAKRKAEEAKVAIREVRRKGNEQLRKEKNGGQLTEEEEKKLEKKIQKLTDGFCHQLDELWSKKEKEIMAV